MDMLKKAIRTADDVLYTIGLQRRQTGMDYVVPAMQWLLVGAVIGGCVALLLAPSTGEDLRSQLGEKLQNARD
jgi:predicted lysophospholipase L1 biosynthesis ABC-type transport system permease subunit